jgi:hypothetical protein
VAVDHSEPPDLDRPRSVGEVLVTALRLYAQHPLLFVALGLIVVAPYELIVLAITNTSTLSTKTTTTTQLVLTLVDLALIGPLIAAFIVHAVRMSAQGERPTFVGVLRRGLVVLPVVAAAQIIAGIGIFLGLLAFVIPGVILTVRWAVVAQAAAIERTDWPGALRRSLQLTRGQFLHSLAVVAVMGVIEAVLLYAAGAAASGAGRLVQVIVVIAIVTISRSFSEVGIAVLYFDLVARGRTGPTVRAS